MPTRRRSPARCISPARARGVNKALRPTLKPSEADAMLRFWVIIAGIEYFWLLLLGYWIGYLEYYEPPKKIFLLERAPVCEWLLSIIASEHVATSIATSSRLKILVFECVVRTLVLFLPGALAILYAMFVGITRKHKV